MSQSRWATSEELKSKLSPISSGLKIEKSGIPMMYDEKSIYIKNDGEQTLVIGTSGSGKTQSVILPHLRLVIEAEESFIFHDVKGEIYEVLSDKLKSKNYKTIVIDLDNTETGNSFNPLNYPYKLYMNNEKDKAVELLENLGYYFCCEDRFDSSLDPFWNNSATSLFVGLSLYLFDNNPADKINLGNILNLVTELDSLKEKVKEYDKLSPVYINLSNIILAPQETRGSIVSVFIQKLKTLISRESLLKLLSTTDFDIENIKKEKTAMFIISKSKDISSRLIPIIVEETYFAATNNYEKTDKRLSILIDGFETLVPFKNFPKMLSNSRGFDINFSIYIRSLLELKNTYGKEKAELIKMLSGNIIYLLANDMDTLQEISSLCGQTQTEKGIEPLITKEELKLLNNFEAIILIPRVYPIKTKLLPDYKIDWTI